MQQESAFEKLKREQVREDKIKGEIISCSDFMLKVLPENKWVVSGLIPEGLTLFSAAPGNFKTFLLLNLSKQIANGELGFNYFKLEKRNILFINEEMSQRTMQDRLKILNCNTPNIYLTNLAGIKVDDTAILLKKCKEKEITLVIFDSLIRIHNFSENDASDMKKIFEFFLILLKEGISIIITQHNRKLYMGIKNGSDEVRGSTELIAQADCHLSIDEVSNDKTYIVIKQLKLRQAENLPDFKINIEKNKELNKISFNYGGEFTMEDKKNITIEKNSESILEIIKQNQGLTKEEIISKTKIGKRAVKAILPKLEEQDLIYCKTFHPKTYYFKDRNNELF
jgi:hypothetical protein